MNSLLVIMPIAEIDLAREETFAAVTICVMNDASRRL
jgi:hypothetical protein